MEKEQRGQKRTQRDYSYDFKVQVVREVESGESTIREIVNRYGIQSYSSVLNWVRKLGSFDWANKSPANMPKTPEQRILELEAKVKLLEKQKASLEHQAEQSDRKAIIFDMMIDLAEKEYKIPIRKNSLPGQSKNTENKDKKR